MFFPQRRVKRTRNGEYVLRISQEERDLLRTLPGQLRALLTTDDPALERLFPPAYLGDDAETVAHNEEYRRYMRSELVERRQSALDVMEQTIDQERLTEEQLLGWLAALNDLRLVLGTRLDVSEDLDLDELGPDDPRAPGLALYGYLSWLQEHVIEALSATVPDEGTEPE